MKALIMNIFKNINIQSLDFTRIKKNFISHIYKLISESSIQILLPFFLIKFWGAANFGIWIMLNSISIILSLLLLRYNHSAQQAMTKELFQKNNYKRKIVYSNGLTLVLLNSLFFLVLCLILYLLATNSNTHLFNFLANADKGYYLATLILLFSIMIRYVVSFYYHSLYNQKGQLSTSVYIRNTLNFLSKISLIIYASISNDFVNAALLLLLFDLFEWIFFIYLNNKNKIPFTFDSKLISKTELFILFKKSIPNNIEIYINNIHAHIGILLFGYFFSEEIVSFIVTAKVLFYYFPYKIFNTINSVFYFEYAKQIFSKKYQYLTKIIQFQSVVIVLFLFIFISITYLVGDTVYNIWIKHFIIEKKFMMMLAFSVSLLVLVELTRTLAKSLNNYLYVTILEFFLTLMTIGATYYFFSLGFNYIYYFYLLIVQYSIVFIADAVCFKKISKDLS